MIVFNSYITFKLSCSSQAVPCIVLQNDKKMCIKRLKTVVVHGTLSFKVKCFYFQQTSKVNNQPLKMSTVITKLKLIINSYIPSDHYKNNALMSTTIIDNSHDISRIPL